MAKKDKIDETPIEFHIPPADLGGKGGRVPVPINQPNWKYKINPNTDSVGLAIAGIFLIIAIALSILLIVSRMCTSPLWLVVIVFGIIAFISARSAKTLEFQNTENDEDGTPPKRKDKKHPKRRKDYK